MPCCISSVGYTYHYVYSHSQTVNQTHCICPAALSVPFIETDPSRRLLQIVDSRLCDCMVKKQRICLAV